MEDVLKQAEDPNLWSDQTKAKAVMREKSRLESALEGFEEISTKFEDAQVMLELASEEKDEDAKAEAMAELKEVHKRVSQMETEQLLSGEADANNAFLEIHSGAGGTESQDWASILERMYYRWGERRGFKVEIVEETKGDEAGIKSATLLIQGLYAYGLLKTEIGVHRLVRISPFDSQSRRHTSFASVFSYPEVDDDIDIVIEEKDLRIDTFRASGAGGQHVNTTDSAVRITHIPTNTVVSCQQERSQHKNRDKAMSMLKAKLFELEIRKQQEEKDALEASKTENGWGNQIRSYVLHPYRMVKDLRTGVESSDADGVLDGDIDQYIQEALAQKLTAGAQRTA